MKYSVLTFNFNNYEIFREPKEVDPECEYIYVTDNHEYKSDIWNIVVDEKLKGKNPIYQSYYVRYHSQEYCHTDTIFILDSSFIIRKSLRDIYERFMQSKCEVCLSCNIYCPTPEKDIEFWKTHRALSEFDYNRLHLLCLSYLPAVGKNKGYKGNFESGFQIIHNTKLVRRFHRQIWLTALWLGNEEVPLRLDEVVMACVFYKYFRTMKVMPVCRQIIQSQYLCYCFHNTNTPKVKTLKLGNCFFLNNHIRPVMM